MGFTGVDIINYLYWKEARSVPEISREFGMSRDRLYGLMIKHGIPKRSRSEVNYVIYKNKPQFQIRVELTAEQKRLRTAGLMLYLAEGNKKNRNQIDLANSDPNVIILFMRFLREICGVAETRLRMFLYVYEGQDIAAIKNYWSELTGIPIGKFTKPYVKPMRGGCSRQHMLPYGVAHVRYSDTRLFAKIFELIHEEIRNLLG